MSRPRDSKAVLPETSPPLILFFGAAGSGKTSVINVMCDQKEFLTKKTSAFSMHPLKLTESESIILVDAPATESTIGPSLNAFLKSVSSHRIGGAVLVFSKGYIDSATRKAYEIVRTIATQLDIPLFAVITHIDGDSKINGWGEENLPFLDWDLDAVISISALPDTELATKKTGMAEACRENREEGRKFFLEQLKNKALLGDKGKINVGVEILSPKLSVSSAIFTSTSTPEMDPPPKEQKRCVIS